MSQQPAISLTISRLRIEMPNEPGAFGVLANAIGDAGGAIGAVDMHTVGRRADRARRDDRGCLGNASPTRFAARSRRSTARGSSSPSDSTFLAHIGGKIRVDSKITIKSRQDLSTVYTPGVARVSMAIAADPGESLPADHQAQ